MCNLFLSYPTCFKVNNCDDRLQTGAWCGCASDLQGVRSATLHSALPADPLFVGAEQPLRVSLGFRSTDRHGTLLRSSSQVRPCMTHVQLSKRLKEPKTTLSVFSDFLQGSTSAPDLQLSLDDGYAVLNSDNYTLRSDKRYSDGSWHYMSAVRSSTGWDTMTSVCPQLRSSSQLKCSKITQLACVYLIFSGWSSASITWESLRDNRSAAGHSGRNWKEAISLAASLTFTQGGLETLEICSHIDDIRRLFLIITWIYVFIKNLIRHRPGQSFIPVDLSSYSLAGDVDLGPCRLDPRPHTDVLPAPVQKRPKAQKPVSTKKSLLLQDHDNSSLGFMISYWCRSFLRCVSDSGSGRQPV